MEYNGFGMFLVCEIVGNMLGYFGTYSWHMGYVVMATMLK